MSDKYEYNFNIIRFKSNEYVPLDKLNTIDKIIMASKYYLDKTYRDNARMQKKIREEQLRNERVFFLRNYLLDIISELPIESKDVRIQIDKSYTDVLEQTLSSGFEDYNYYVLRMNKNYLRFIKNPHPILIFNIREDCKEQLILDSEVHRSYEEEFSDLFE